MRPPSLPGYHGTPRRPDRCSRPEPVATAKSSALQGSFANDITKVYVDTSGAPCRDVAGFIIPGRYHHRSLVDAVAGERVSDIACYGNLVNLIISRDSSSGICGPECLDDVSPVPEGEVPCLSKVSRGSGAERCCKSAESCFSAGIHHRGQRVGVRWRESPFSRL